MPSLLDDPRPARRSGVRRLCVCSLRACLGVLNLALAGLALLVGAILLSAHLRREIPVPAFLLRNLEERLAAEGLRARWSGIAFDLTGCVHARGLQLETLTGEPLVRASHVLLLLDSKALLERRVVPRELHIDDAALMLPARLSPEGIDSAVLDAVSGGIFFEGSVQRLRYAQALFDGVALRVGGTLPTQAPSTEREPLARLLARAADAALQARAFTSPLRNASVSLDLDARTAYVLAGVVHDQLNAPAVELALVEQADGAVQATLNVAALEVRGAVATGVQASILARDPHSLRVDNLPGGLVGEIWAASASYRECRIGGLFARPLASGDSPLDGMAGAVNVAGDVIELTWRPDGDAHVVTARGALRPFETLALAGVQARGVRSRVSLKSPILFRATAHIPAALEDWRVEADVDAWDIDIRGTPVSHAHVSLEGDAHSIDAHRVWLTLGAESGDCTWLQDLDTLDWRLTVLGEAYPPALGPALGRWWETIWPGFDFSGPPIWTDLEVRGNWNDRTWAHATARAYAKDMSYNGVQIDELALDLRCGRHWFELYDLRACTREGGTMSGELRWLMPREQPLHISFDLRSQMDLPSINQAFGANLGELASAWRFSEFPALHMRGNIEHPQGGGWTTELVAEAWTGPGHWRGIDFDSLVLSMRNGPSATSVDSLSARMCGGELGGWLRFAHPRGEPSAFTCSLALTNADLTPTGIALQSLGSGKPPAHPTPQRAGRVDLAFEGGAAIGNLLDTLRGRGHLRVYDADLGSVGVFGALSDVLLSLGIGVGTFTFDSLQSSLSVDNGLVLFEEAQLSGPSAIVDARGGLALADQRLDFDARVFLMLGQQRSAFNIVGLLLSPFGYVLELRLRGTLDEPTWRFKIDPRNFFDTGEGDLDVPWDQLDPQTVTAPALRRAGK